MLDSTWEAIDGFRESHPRVCKLARHLASPFKLHPAIVVAILVMIVMKGPTGTVTSMWEQICSFAVTFLCDGSGLAQVFWSTAPLALSVTLIITLLSLEVVKPNPFGLLVCAVITLAGAGIGNRCGGIFDDLASRKMSPAALSPTRPSADLVSGKQPPAHSISDIQYVNLPRNVGVGVNRIHSPSADREKTLLPPLSLASSGMTSAANVNRLSIHPDKDRPAPSVRIVVSPDLADRANQSEKLSMLLHQLEEVSVRLEHDAASQLNAKTNAKLSESTNNVYYKAYFVVCEYFLQYGARLFASSVIIGAYLGARWSSWIKKLLAILNDDLA